MLFFIFTASLAVYVALAAPLTSSLAAEEVNIRTRAGYTTFKGDGSAAAGWPAESAWVDFETMFNANVPTMQVSCANNGGGANDSPAEINDIKTHVNGVAGSSGVDARFILAVIMQESKGCVRIPSTKNAVINPGLMQGSGTNTCNPGTPINPCSDATINGMIADGTTGSGGLKDCLGKATGAGSQKTYQAAKLYNSGINSALTDLAANAATPCYASDIANRLTGFVGTSPCTL